MTKISRKEFDELIYILQDPQVLIKRYIYTFNILDKHLEEIYEKETDYIPQELKEQYKFYRDLFFEVNEVKNLEELKIPYKKFTSKNYLCKYNLIIGSMMATTHIFWKKLLIYNYGYDEITNTYQNPKPALEIASGKSYIEICQELMYNFNNEIL